MKNQLLNYTNKCCQDHAFSSRSIQLKELHNGQIAQEGRPNFVTRDRVTLNYPLSTSISHSARPLTAERT